MYEPAVAEEEALPEPEAAPAAKGECDIVNLCFSCCGFSSPLKSFHRLSVFKALKHYNQNWYQ